MALRNSLRANVLNVRTKSTTWNDSKNSSTLQPNNDVDTLDLCPGRRSREAVDTHVPPRNVDEPVLALKVEVVMVTCVGIKVDPCTVDNDLPQQPRLRELVQRVVDSRQRQRRTGTQRFTVQGLLRRRLLLLVGA